MSTVSENLAQGQDLFEGVTSTREHDDATDNKVAGVYSHIPTEYSATEHESLIDWSKWVRLHLRDTSLVALRVRNVSGSNLAAGALTYVTGYNLALSRWTVAGSNAANGSRWAQFVVPEAVTNSSNGVAYAVTTEAGVTYPSGVRTGSLNTSMFAAVGDLVYMDATSPGAWANSAPTNGAFPVGRVLVVGAANGEILFTPGGFNGPASVSNALSATGVTAGTYGNATHVAQVTVDARGRVTSASNVAISAGGGNLSGTGTTNQIAYWASTNTLAAIGTMNAGQLLIGNTAGPPNVAAPTNSSNVAWTVGNGSLSADLVATSVAAGAYGNATHVAAITVDANGRLTAASNVAISGVGNSESNANNVLRYERFY